LATHIKHYVPLIAGMEKGKLPKHVLHWCREKKEKENLSLPLKTIVWGRCTGYPGRSEELYFEIKRK